MMNSSLYSNLSLNIASLLGIHFPENRWNDLERGLLAAAKDLKIDENLASIGHWLSDPGPSGHDLKVLSSHLTVGETYFFREINALELFQKRIIPEIMEERRGNTREIRIWSAGCSSGEEAYSLAIILKETITDINNWNITILATDINPDALTKAKQGIYSAWSFRETSEDVKRKYFTGTGKTWKIIPEIKEMVTFSNLNLAEDIFPLNTTNTNRLDVIFCRNVLMYFAPEKATEVGSRFFNALNENGWLITSQVELNDDYFSLFSRNQFRNGIYYHKVPTYAPLTKKGVTVTDTKVVRSKVTRQVRKRVEPPTPVSPPANPGAAATVGVMSPAALFEKGEYRACVEECHRIIDQVAADGEILVLLIRSNANLGQLGEARLWAEKLIAKSGTHADDYFLYATILLELNEVTEAEVALKKALYLEPDHLFVHLTLGNVMKRLGKGQLAIKHFRDTKVLLERFQDDEVVPDSDGLTAGRIREMIRTTTETQRIQR